MNLQFVRLFMNFHNECLSVFRIMRAISNKIGVRLNLDLILKKKNHIYRCTVIYNDVKIVGTREYSISQYN